MIDIVIYDKSYIIQLCLDWYLQLYIEGKHDRKHEKQTIFNPFVPIALFLYPLKTSENL